VHKQGLGGWEIFGIIAGVIVLVAGAILAVYFIRKPKAYAHIEDRQ